MWFPTTLNMRRVLRPCDVMVVPAALLLILAAACGSDSPVSDTPTAAATPTIVFTLGSGETASLTVEIADTPEKRSQGLMGRESLPDLAGMLFVWPEDTSAGFWMKDTLIPLSIAFIDTEGKIVDIQDMQPLDETLHHSPQPYRYAVETNQGWFEEHRIEAGDAVSFPESVSTPGS